MNFKKKNDRQILLLEECKIENGNVVPLLKFQNLEASGIVKHCFTTRMGGVSRGIFSSMNLSFTRGDEKESVEENYRRIASALEVDYEAFVCTDQTHTTNVRKVTTKDKGYGVTRAKNYTDVDGLITNEPGLVLSTFYADCVPLYFVDPVNKAIGLSHSGWRGTVNRMGKATIEAMKKEYGTNPKDLLCAIGPSICQECYEVSGDVAEEFSKAFSGKEEEILKQKDNMKMCEPKYQLDLWRANVIILTEAGVPEENIAVTNICTCCNPKLLFSHRASQGKRGNLAAFMCLK